MKSSLLLLVNCLVVVSLWGAIVLVSGCATARKGFIEIDGPTVLLVESRGTKIPVKGPSLELGLRQLDEHLLQVWGKRTPNAFRVDRYRVLEGTHGISVWMGRIAIRAGVLGLVDVEGSLFRPLREMEEGALTEHIGDLVLVEGYIEGAERVRVVYYRVLVYGGA